MTKPWSGASPGYRLTRSGAVPSPPPAQPTRQLQPHQQAAPQVQPTANSNRVAQGRAGAAEVACLAAGAVGDMGAALAATAGRRGPRLKQCWRSPMPATSPGAPPFPSPPSAARPRASCAWRTRSRTSPCRAAICACAAAARGGCRTAPTAAHPSSSGYTREWSDLEHSVGVWTALVLVVIKTTFRTNPSPYYPRGHLSLCQFFAARHVVCAPALRGCRWFIHILK